MLPDFPEVKAHLRANLIRWAHEQIPHFAPLLGEVGRFLQHEGKQTHLTRADQSEAVLDPSKNPLSFTLELTRDEMRRLDLLGLFEKFANLAEQMASAQSRMLFSKVSEAVEMTGNKVSAGGDFRPEHFFELLMKTELNFDPVTGAPVGHSFVMHPDTAAKVIPLMKTWESDPAFVAEHERILNLKRDEWRARENCRQLVD